MKFSIMVSGSPSGCPAMSVGDSVHDVVLADSLNPPKPGEPALNYQCGITCHSWASGVSCDYDKCDLGKIIRVKFLPPLATGLGATRNEVLLRGVTCPKCGHPVACVYWENGAGNSFVDNFVHKCTNHDCNNILEGPDEKWGGENNNEDPWPNCPFCHRSSVESSVKSSIE